MDHGSIGTTDMRRSRAITFVAAIAATVVAVLLVGSAPASARERAFAGGSGSTSPSSSAGQTAPSDEPAGSDAAVGPQTEIGTAISVTRGQPRPAEVSGVVIVDQGSAAPAASDPRTVQTVARSAPAAATGAPELARTGVSMEWLAALGIALVMLGSLLVKHSARPIAGPVLTIG